MPRIVYTAFPTGDVSGGQKVILRHVEELRRLGFDAVYWRTPANTMPTWLDHESPVEVGTPLRPDDIIVLPGDAPNSIAQAAGMPQRSLIFCQNQFSFAATSLEAVDRYPPQRLPTFIAVGASCAAAIQRAYPEGQVEIVPCFADERVFAVNGQKSSAIALSPRKRPMEAQAIRHLLRKLHARHGGLEWRPVENVPELDVARVFAGSTLFLSLSRFESVGMTPLEAMASGCLCAGFTGIGGWDFASAENGFWAPEDDLYAAADALAEAADLAATGGPAYRRMIEAGQATARAWSYANFRLALEEVWSRLAPDARTLPPSGA